MRLISFAGVDLPVLNEDVDTPVSARSALVPLADGSFDQDGQAAVFQPVTIRRSFVLSTDPDDYDDVLDALMTAFARGRNVLVARRRDGKEVQTFAKVVSVSRPRKGAVEPFPVVDVTFQQDYPFWFESTDEPLYLDTGWNLDGTPRAGVGTISQSGTTVTGVGTAFLTAVSAGETIGGNDRPQTIAGEVQTVTDDTHVELDTSATAGSQAFTIYADDALELDGNHDDVTIDSTSESLTLTAAGTVPVRRGVLVLIPESGASLTNLVIRNTANMMELRYLATLAYPDVLVIDLLAKSCKKSAVNDYAGIELPVGQMDWMVLELGTNEMQILCDSVTGNILLEWHWAGVYL